MFKGFLKEVRRALAQRSASRAPQFDPFLNKASAFANGGPTERDNLVIELQQRLKEQPDDLRGRIELGDWLLRLNRYSEAEIAYREALKLKPLHARGQEGLGITLLQLGRLEESYLHLETSCKLDPMNPEPLIHWGLVDLELGNLEQAAEKFQRAIERTPSNPHAWHNLGLVAFRQGNARLSLKYLTHSISLKPDHGLAYSNIALAALHCDDLEGALDAAKNAVALKISNSRTWVVHGDVMLSAGQFSNAESSFLKAINLNPDSPIPWIGLAKFRMATGAYAASESAFRHAIELDSGNANARAGWGQLLLLQGRWESGWDLYEARRKTELRPVRSMPFAEWQGEDLHGKSILVHAEQGLGDIILFSSCIPDLVSSGAHCVVEAPPRLHSLFKRSFPQANVCCHDPMEDGDEWLEEIGAIDFHIPIGSLPCALRRTDSNFPSRTRYLKGSQIGSIYWRQAFSAYSKPLIGITWKGGLLNTASMQRSVALLDLALALKDVGVSLVCLQHGDVSDELARVQRELDIDIHPGIPGFPDLDEVASLTSALDGVVTVCCTQAHLTGALGIPGVVLVPNNPNWRYGSEGERMPWYSSLHLVRQTIAFDWTAPLHSVSKWASGLTKGAPHEPLY